MTKVTLENCNEIIAEFEFGKDYWLEDLIVEWEYGEGQYNNAKKLYTESLDSLVPVWDKIGTYPDFEQEDGFSDFGCVISLYHMHIQAWGKDVYQAAALATAKAIVELNQ